MPYNTEKGRKILSVNTMDSSFAAVHQFADKIYAVVNCEDNYGYNVSYKAVIKWKKIEKNCLTLWWIFVT